MLLLFFVLCLEFFAYLYAKIVHIVVFLSFQSDAISMLEKELDFKDEHLDFIQQHIRKFCLKCILLKTLKCFVLNQSSIIVQDLPYKCERNTFMRRGSTSANTV